MATVQPRKNLIERLRRHRDDLRRLGVERIGLFGSFHRDEPDAESDMDLLVECAPGEKSFDNFMAVSLTSCGTWQRGRRPHWPSRSAKFSNRRAQHAHATADAGQMPYSSMVPQVLILCEGLAQRG